MTDRCPLCSVRFGGHARAAGKPAECLAIVGLVLGLGLIPAWKAVGEPAPAERKEGATRKGPGAKVQKLFDGKSLQGWKVTEFGGDGPVTVEQGRLTLGAGVTLTGVKWTGPFPKANYEVRLEAMRVDGSDFFCAMTFPVGKEFCSLIVGGWGGGVVGLSSINGMDASENETTQFARFKEGQWYAIRLRVTDEKIEAWIDKEQVVNVPRADREFSVRIEVELSKPFGLASWQTTAALRNITLHGLPVPQGSPAP